MPPFYKEVKRMSDKMFATVIRERAGVFGSSPSRGAPGAW
jgi:hypothetical protein